MFRSYVESCRPCRNMTSTKSARSLVRLRSSERRSAPGSCSPRAPNFVLTTKLSRGTPGQRLAQHDLALVVDGRGIEQIDAKVEGMLDKAMHRRRRSVWLTWPKRLAPPEPRLRRETCRLVRPRVRYSTSAPDRRPTCEGELCEHGSYSSDHGSHAGAPRRGGDELHSSGHRRRTDDGRAACAVSAERRADRRSASRVAGWIRLTPG